MQVLCQFESGTERQWNSALHQLIGRILNSPATFARQFLPGVWCVFAAAVLLAPVNATSAANLAPHTAHYVMKLLSARGGSGIEAVSGDMAIRWEGDCSGWTMSNRAVFDVTYTGGDAVRVTMDASTWEAAAGDRYTFLVRTLFDTKETQRVEGKARLDGGTMFPTMHTKRVLDAAGDTPEIIRATVFDGFTDGGAQFVNAIVGKKLATGQTAASAFPTLQNQPAWGISLAFFDADKADAEPNSEIRLEIYRNGIAGMIEMDFGDFRLLAELKELESGKPPVCS